MKRGEEWALPARDRGEVRALARDYVDSRRVLISEYILFLILLLIVGVFVFGRTRNSSIVLYLELGIVALIALESLYHAMRVTRIARQRFPGTSTRGTTWYIAKRIVRMRSSRIPPARVGRGGSF